MSRRYRGRHRRRSLRAVATLAFAALSLAGLALPGAYGGYFAKITNINNAASSATYFTCTAAAQGAAAANSYFAYPLGESTGSVTATDVSAGTPAQTARNGTYSTALNLGVLLPVGVTQGVANSGAGAVCPRDKQTVTTFNGSSGYVSGPAAAIAGPNTFTVEIWFKTSVKQGKLIGFGDARTGASGAFDRHLYINTSGNLVFGVYQAVTGGSVVKTVASSAVVTNGAWHQAVATVSATATTNPTVPAGMVLYLDGVQVGSDPTATSGQAFNGFWRIGYDNLNSGWPGSGTNYYFNGQLAFASAYPIALSSTQVAQHYRAGTA